MEEKGLNHPHQYGFTRGCGITSALAMCYEWIARQKAKKHSRITMVTRDIKGAFDYLPQRRIKYHLCTIGLPLCFSKHSVVFWTAGLPKSNAVIS